MVAVKWLLCWGPSYSVKMVAGAQSCDILPSVGKHCLVLLFLNACLNVCGCVCVFICVHECVCGLVRGMCGSECWYVWLLQEWSLFLITGPRPCDLNKG